MAPLNPSAPHDLPFFITAPGDTDVLMVIAGVTVIAAALLAGVFFLHVHSLPERLAHKGQKLQFELVAVMCLLALFTHAHVLWVAALLLAFIDLPDFLSPLNRIARSQEKLAGLPSPPQPSEDEKLKEGGHA
ncbi:hypothetical protein MKI84_08810 [Ancylobacter sp. A5.8]|uniref:hypothetical protein n=1 Tax=Ancylobacter gelatini TaxID=2919920 RepID=UPI001F4DD1D4|nr:hypothetical protein [Ancylobacter gelatini]MCJ8143016.1 hypothetical protein [Ancylobacter gelatini]